MTTGESIIDFHQQQGNPIPGPVGQTDALKTGLFKVYDVEHFCATDLTFNRRDFYKISLLTGMGRLEYASRSVLIDRPALVFSNPRVPYAYELLTPTQGGYFCVFTEDFLTTGGRSVSLQESPLFKVGNDPVFFVDSEQFDRLRLWFKQLLAERNSVYPFKNELLRSYVNLILHEAMKMQPLTTYLPQTNANHRIVTLFLELLERQFPIDSPQRPLTLRTAGDFANCLSVHVNHLNRAVREQTGKTTTAHIAKHITNEAKALLQHTDWPVADIAHALGFEYATYFNTFFKRQTGLIPKQVRR